MPRATTRFLTVGQHGIKLPGILHLFSSIQLNYLSLTFSILITMHLAHSFILLAMTLSAWSHPTYPVETIEVRSNLHKRAPPMRCGQLTCQEAVLYEPDSQTDIVLIPAQVHATHQRVVRIQYLDNLPGGDPRIQLRNDYDFGISLTINNVAQGQSNDYRITWVNGAVRSLSLGNFHAWEDGDDIQYIIKYVVPH